MVTVQIITGHWFRWRLVEQQGETILEKESFFTTDLRISKNRFMDIQKSD